MLTKGGASDDTQGEESKPELKLRAGAGLSVREAYSRRGAAAAKHAEEAARAVAKPSNRELLRKSGFLEDAGDYDSAEEDGDGLATEGGTDGTLEVAPSGGVDYAGILAARRRAQADAAAAKAKAAREDEERHEAPDRAGRAAKQAQARRLTAEERAKRPAAPDAAVNAKYGKAKRSRVQSRGGERSINFK